MTGWLIYDKKQYEVNSWFAGELLRYCGIFSDMRLIIVEKLKYGVADSGIGFMYEGKKLKIPDYAICRTIAPVLSYTLEMSGIRVYNRYDISRICNDKRMSYIYAASLGVPVMNTELYGGMAGDDLKGLIKYPVIVKTAAGHGGKEVELVRDTEELSMYIEKNRDGNFLLQDIYKPWGNDVRTYVLGGNIICSCLRQSETFKSNYTLGGSTRPYMLDETERQMVNKLVKALPCVPDFIGVDLLVGGDAPVFNEMEDVVGTRMLYANAQLNAAETFADYIRKDMQK